MGRLQFKDNGEEHNSYQSYTDLMSGFLIVFMIASIVAIVIYKNKVSEYQAVIDWRKRYEKTVEFIEGNGGITSGDIKVTFELSLAIDALRHAQEQINNKYIEYDAEHNMFRVMKYVDFDYQNPKIPEKDKQDLIDIGRSIQGIVAQFKDNQYIGFKIIIDGRIGEGESETIPGSQRNLSYNRALNLFNLWVDNNLIYLTYDSAHQSADVMLSDKNVIVSGSGLGGDGRVPGKNRTCVIQIIPYIKTNLKDM